MKTKLISIFALAIMVTSCSNQELIDSDFQQPSPQQTSSIRSYEEALQIAQASIQMVDGQAKTRAASPRKISLNDSKVCLTDSKTRSENGNDTLMYVFNFENNQGFSIVSANKNADPLIAVTESGYYDPTVPSEIEGFNMYMDMAKMYLSKIPGNRLDPILPDGHDSIAFEFSYVGPFVNVNWGQRYPEGEYCSNGICGCSNTAIAQIMSYYEYPTSTQITYPDADTTYQTFSWYSMKSHETGHDVSVCSIFGIHKSIGRLCRQSGYIAGSNYNNGATGTTRDGIITSLQFFGYKTNSWVDYNSTIKDSLDCYHPLLVSGRRLDGYIYRGHTWVLDGYQQLARYHYWLSQLIVGSDEWVATLLDTTYTYMYHYNWGWYGNNNGYYNYNVFNTEMGLYDGNHSTYNRDYYYDVKVLCAYPDTSN